MELIIKNNEKAEHFIHIFQNIKSFNDCFNLEVNTDEFYIQGMDSSHVSIFEVKLHRDWFDKFDIKKTLTLGISCNIFPKILTTWTSDHSIKLEMDEGESSLNISFEKVDGNSEYNKYFEIPLIDMDTEKLHIPDQEYTLDIEIDSKKFKKLIDELGMIGDTVDFVCNETEINATSKSIEGSMTINIPFDDIDAYSIEENETLNLTFSLKYLRIIGQFYKASSSVCLYMTSGNPVQIKYTFDDHSYVRFYVAPSIED